MANAAKPTEESEDSGEEPEKLPELSMPRHVGSLDLVHRTLQGIAARSEDDGAEGFGRHAATIRLGKALWQSAPLNT